jgi:hypothetical protein
VRAFIELLAGDPRKPTAAAIRRAAIRSFGATPVPALKGVQAIVARIRRQRDPSAVWRLSQADPDEAALVLPVLGEVLKLTNWQERSLTNAEAEWIVRLRRAVPDLELVDVIRYARQYVARGDGTTDDLDRALASGAWRSLAAAVAAHYGEAIAAQEESDQ